MTGTVVDNKKWNTGAKEDALAVQLDLPEGIAEALFVFDKVLVPDSPAFPFALGDRVEVIIRTVEGCDQGLRLSDSQ